MSSSPSLGTELNWVTLDHSLSPRSRKTATANCCLVKKIQIKVKKAFHLIIEKQFNVRMSAYIWGEAETTQETLLILENPGTFRGLRLFD